MKLYLYTFATVPSISVGILKSLNQDFMGQDFMALVGNVLLNEKMSSPEKGKEEKAMCSCALSESTFVLRCIVLLS